MVTLWRSWRQCPHRKALQSTCLELPICTLVGNKSGAGFYFCNQIRKKADVLYLVKALVRCRGGVHFVCPCQLIRYINRPAARKGSLHPRQLASLNQRLQLNIIRHLLQEGFSQSFIQNITSHFQDEFMPFTQDLARQFWLVWEQNLVAG